MHEQRGGTDRNETSLNRVANLGRAQWPERKSSHWLSLFSDDAAAARQNWLKKELGAYSLDNKSF